MEKVVVFGATSAMAQETARLLAARGAELVLVGRDPERLDAVAADARVRGARRVQAMAADLDDAERHAELLGRAASFLGRVDLVLLAQGLLAGSDACEADAALAERVLLTNLVAPALLLQRAAGLLAAQGSGTIVAISSVAGDRGRQSNYVYGASKAGLSTLLGGLRNRLFRRGVHVVTVKPGPVDSAMTDGLPRAPRRAAPSVVAAAIVRAVERRRDVVYAPGRWRVIMAVVRHVPEWIFKRLRL